MAWRQALFAGHHPANTALQQSSATSSIMNRVPLLCYLDAFSGISGDMLVAALADAGADQAAIIDAVASLEIGAVLSFERVKRCGIAATKFHVSAQETHAHRHLTHILKMIEKAALPERAKQNAAAV